MYDHSPPPPPDDNAMSPPRPAGLSAVALLLAGLALLLALPVLWWRLTSPSGASLTVEIIGAITQSAAAGPPWLVGMRAAAMLLAFLALISAVVGLILRHSGRQAAIALVLAMAALAAASLGVMLATVLGVVLLAVLLLGMGIG